MTIKTKLYPKAYYTTTFLINCFPNKRFIQLISPVEELKLCEMHHFFNLVSTFPLVSLKNITDGMPNQTSTATILWNQTALIRDLKKNWPIQEWIDDGYFTEEYIKDINVHWLKYPSPEPINFYIFGAIYLFITIIGLVGNVLVIYLFIR